MLKDTTIVFDLDGTLVDTAPDLTHALNHALAERGHAPVTLDAIRATVGRGARAMIEAALALSGIEDDVDRLLATFLVYYEANIAAESRPFPGAETALERFKSSGVLLAICTNKREQLSRKLLEAIELDGFFHAIAGRDTFPVSKPDPGHLTGAIKLAGGDPANAVMVGDSVTDIETAKAASIPSILVGFGYGPLPPAGLVPDAVIDSFEALEDAAIALVNGARPVPARS
jgi:phosphoglycolate phosphatase